MTESPRLKQIQAWLADSPDDLELRYALAMEYRSVGDDERTAEQLKSLIADKPDYIASYLMLAQTLVKLIRDDEAKDVLRTGIAAAKRAGHEHAMGEMQGMLESLEG
jgi:thioredoxin-like negative regulator of GroEL